MENPLVIKLQNFSRLSSEDKAALDHVAARRVVHFEPHEEIIAEDEDPKAINLVLDGWACRYKDLEDGRRQIISFFLPGDLCDLHIFILRKMDHSLGALTHGTIAKITQDDFETLTLGQPRIMQALWWESLVTTAIQREWTVNVGQRSATERIAHLLCELFVRLAAIGRTDGAECPFPLTQAELADATGLSTVHVNRTVQELRAAELIILKGKTLTVLDLQALKRLAQFNPNYLHLEREGSHLDANE